MFGGGRIVSASLGASIKDVGTGLLTHKSKCKACRSLRDRRTCSHVSNYAVVRARTRISTLLRGVIAGVGSTCYPGGAMSASIACASTSKGRMSLGKGGILSTTGYTIKRSKRLPPERLFAHIKVSHCAGIAKSSKGACCMCGRRSRGSPAALCSLGGVDVGGRLHGRVALVPCGGRGNASCPLNRGLVDL